MQTMSQIPSTSIIPTTVHEPEIDSYHFYVKETVNSVCGEDLIFPCLSNLNLKWLRAKLRKKFNVPETRHIFYIDDDGDHVPIDSECEFNEALKLARNAFAMNTTIPLIVGSFGVFYEEDIPRVYKNRSSHKKLLNNIDDKQIKKYFNSFHTSLSKSSFFNNSQQPYYSRKLKLEHDKQRHINLEVSPNQNKFDARQCDEPNEIKVRRIDEQTELKDTDIQRESNASLQHSTDDLPPVWFTKYMESMKEDMVSTITNEVVKNVTETLNKHLNSFVFPPLMELYQSENQRSSFATLHSQCSDLNKEIQKKIKSEDKEQLNDVLAEIRAIRANELRNENSMKENIKMKEYMTSTINEMFKDWERLFKNPANPLKSVLSDISSQNQIPLQMLSPLPSSSRLPHSFNSHSSEKNEKTIKSQNKEQSSDIASTVRVDESSRYSNILENSTKQLQKRFDLIDTLCAERPKEEKEAQSSSELLKVLGIEKEQSVRNNTLEDLVSRKNLPLQNPKPSDEKVPLEELKLIENELRMNCSVTGHQMLDEGLLSRNIRNAFDNKLSEVKTDVEISDNMISFWSCDQDEKEKEKEEDDDAFEIIQMPALTDELFIPFEELIVEQHDSNRDSPSFELLSEPPSPSCSIHLNEDHFSANEEKLEQQSMKTNPVYVVDIHGKIFNNEHQTVNSDERVNIDLKNQSGIIYSLVVDENLLTEDENEEAYSSKSLCAEYQSKERKNPRDDANGSYDDVRNSHASYLTVQTHCDSKMQSQCSCQSQTDSSDFTQSFHSHTTSVIDTTDMYAHTYANKYGEQMTAKNVREATITTATTPKNSHDVRIDSDWTKETRTNEKYRHDECSNDNPKCPPNTDCSYWDPSFDASTTTATTPKNSHDKYPDNYGKCPPGTKCSCWLDLSFDASTTTATTPKNSHDKYPDNYGKCPPGTKCSCWLDLSFDASTTTATTPKNSHDKYPDNDGKCPPGTNCSCWRDPSFDASYQPYEGSRLSDRVLCSDVGSKKTSADDQLLLSTADSVHILPETLVSAAAQVGSFAYDTAREMFGKLRAHTKEDPLKRRGGVKCENKPLSFGHLPLY